MRLVLKFLLIIFVVGVLMSSSTADAQVTPTTSWVNFYSSNSTLNNKPIPAGAVVRALGPDGSLCGEFVVVELGSYGFLACYFDDPNTATDEGIELGDTVMFVINGVFAGSFTVPSEGVGNGARFQVDLAAMPPVEPIPVPEPLSITLLGLGLAALGGYIYRKIPRV